MNSQILIFEKLLPTEIRVILRYLHVSFFLTRKPYLRSNNNCFLKKFGFRHYSQYNEDGIIHYILNSINVRNKNFVEIGSSDGIHCNTANLSINYGWQGLLLDARHDCVNIATKFYNGKIGRNNKVKSVHCLITKDNINSLLKAHNYSGEIDLLSIDIDGNDYYILDSISSTVPRIIIAEYNLFFGCEKAFTIEYNGHLKYQKKYPIYVGASLPALIKLAKSKGYVLVYANGVNAFFVKKELCEGKLKSIEAKECFTENDLVKASQRFQSIKNLPFVYV